MAADVSGTWSTHKEGCAWRKSPDNYPKDFEEIAYLDSKGILGYEWGCDFLVSGKNKWGQSVHVSACAMEGNSWPETILVEKSSTTDGYHVITKENEEPTEFPYKCE
jgi:hypothetical protein